MVIHYVKIHNAVSHKCEYTPHISAIHLVYLFKGQYYRNETWIYLFSIYVYIYIYIYIFISQCATSIAVQIYCPLKMTQRTAIIVKKVYTGENSYTSFNHAQPHILFIRFMFCLLDRIIQMCVSCFRAVTIWFFEYNSLVLTTGCSTWHLMAKNSLMI